jgi:hypothetical protein
MCAWKSPERGVVTDHQASLEGLPLKKVMDIEVSEIHPVIISVSRATDVPAFYMDWFLRRHAEGYIIWKNPYRQDRRQKVLFDKTRAAVFWTKDPGAMLRRIDEINALSWYYYVQVTLNDYEGCGYEPGVPSLRKRIRDFQQLSRLLGRERVVWRYDPLLLSDLVSREDLFRRIASLFSLLGPYCDRMVFSFIEISGYRGVTRNLHQHGLTQVREFTFEEKMETARFLQYCSETHGPIIMACSQGLDLSRFGIVPGRCVDDRLFRKIAFHDADFIRWLDHHAKKDKGQRPHCMCIVSKDVGEYSTCMHLCRYCYANRSDEYVAARYHLHREGVGRGMIPESIVPGS